MPDLEMIDRVARAIHDRTLKDDQLADFGLPMADAITCALASIEAMREPTDHQRNKYYELSGNIDVMCDAYWERSIEAILK